MRLIRASSPAKIPARSCKRYLLTAPNREAGSSFVLFRISHCQTIYCKISKNEVVTIQGIEWGRLKVYSRTREARGAAAPAEVGGAARHPNAAGTRGNRSAGGGAKGQGQSGGAVAMAIGAVRRAIGDLTRLGDGALDGVQIFADFPADRNAQEALFERGAEAREEFGFQGGGELAELQTGLRNADCGMRNAECGLNSRAR
jgi:hypothetical protein